MRLRKLDNKRRREQVGTGNRSEKVRTYNFHRHLVTDERTSERFDLMQILDGNLDPMIDAIYESENS